MSAEAPSGQGTRRIDRVLAEDFLSGLQEAPLADVRALRADAEQEEADLSYVRRLVQGRIDIVKAELARRTGGGSVSLVDSLADVLSEDRGSAHGMGRHVTVEPSRVDAHQRYVETLVADVDLTDTTARSDAELASALDVLAAEEQTVSAKRRKVQEVMDALSAEVTRRYRDGEADVSALLPDQ
ncbi:MAG TPA: aerial mycelium formation protein [Mycobacteriales bacterium]|nr:aerial mycelium formation protein [Mycobacteriales bacterium]